MTMGVHGRQVPLRSLIQCVRRYMKYNAVLRSKSDEPFLVKQYRDLCHGNNYVSTIHAINS